LFTVLVDIDTKVVNVLRPL